MAKAGEVDGEETAQSSHIQFFTTHQDKSGKNAWFPIDHFFLAPYVWDPKRREVVEVPPIARLEQSGDRIYMTGLAEDDARQLRSVPEALRYLADLIEKTGFVSNYQK